VLIDFEEIHGQSRAKKLIGRLIRSTRVPHALLLTGRQGIGKKSFALASAALAMCRDSENNSFSPCGNCNSCRRLRSNMNPDLILIAPEGTVIKIDQVRNIIPELKFKPSYSAKRVIVVEEAEKMTEEAANALLKSLEEPPPHNIFILLATDAHRLLPTIVSRCCQIRLEPVPHEVLKRIAIDKSGLDNDTADVCAFLAGGSIEKLNEWCTEEKLRTWKEVNQVIENLKTQPVWKFFETAKALTERFDSFEDFVYLIKSKLVLFIRSEIRSKRKERLGKLLDTLDFVEEGEQALRFNVNKLLLAEEIGLAIRECMHEEDSWNKISRTRIYSTL